MPRPKIEVPKDIVDKVAEAMEELTVADQLVPLVFDKENMAILLILREAYQSHGLAFSAIGEATGLGKSQKLLDLLRHMIEYGLVEHTNSSYALTELGMSTANFAHRFVSAINADPEVAKKVGLADRYSMIQYAEKKSKELMEKRIREG
jgi:hypothetical protein